MALIVGGTTVTGTQTLDATKLTGNLPEISGADLTNLPAPSAANVGSGAAGLGSTDVGQTAFCREYQGGHSWTGDPGSTTPASNIRFASAGPLSSPSTSINSGTWLRLGRTINPASPQSNQHTLFRRQS
tara:strand:- start:1056 stop:1442 length:387 start_codon:yes stop_codon:yes gene_type:complete